MFTLNTIVKTSQKKLYKRIFRMLKQDGCITDAKHDGYILVPGDAPIMLVAHMDTVHHSLCKVICTSEDGDIMMSPQGIGGDDRCGVYALLKIYNDCKESESKRPWLLFTTDEEIGGIGADKFVDDFDRGYFGPLTKQLNGLHHIVELDRKGSTDAVFYSCDNDEYVTYIKSFGFMKQHGSFSDISTIAPALGVAAVNVSCGYYNAHTEHEYIRVSELERIIKAVKEMIMDSPNCKQYEYVEDVSRNGNVRWLNEYDYFDELDYPQMQDDAFEIPEEYLKEYRLLRWSGYTENEVMNVISAGSSAVYEFVVDALMYVWDTGLDYPREFDDMFDTYNIYDQMLEKYEEDAEKLQIATMDC